MIGSLEQKGNQSFSKSAMKTFLIPLLYVMTRLSALAHYLTRPGSRSCSSPSEYTHTLSNCNNCEATPTPDFIAHILEERIAARQLLSLKRYVIPVLTHGLPVFYLHMPPCPSLGVFIRPQNTILLVLHSWASHIHPGFLMFQTRPCVPLW